MHNYNHTHLTMRQKLKLLWRKRLNPRKELVLQTIGSLVKQIEPMAANLDTQTQSSTRNAASSEPILQGQTPQSRSKNVGLVPFNDGSAKTPAAVLRSAIAQDSPAETNAALEAYLPRSVRSWIDRTETRETWEKLSKSRQYSPEPTRPEPLPQDEHQKALAAVKATLSTVNGAECRKLLAEMKYLTRQRAESTEDIAAQIEIYARKMEAYPADIVRYVIKTQTDNSPWWPAWNELKDRLDLFLSARRRKLVALTTQA